ncbi:MAG TPA: helix-turn-helix transcriptional regulator [Bdellovibrionota bacterium]|jgi:transcriptional regulator with XRE-family HTH domain|nr:helix-turn-helix transcriptional regulator [Bdellovibrionota bacterium]
MVDNGKGASKNPRLVGHFIRQRRESLRLSQRALGQLFEPSVTTQFISNVERGVTPLPPAHVPTLAKALQAPESEIMGLLEREYAVKLSGRLGRARADGDGDSRGSLDVALNDYEFFRTLYDAFRQADDGARKAFQSVCETMLKLPRENARR